MSQRWTMIVRKADLVAAIGNARTRATLRRKGAGFERMILLVASPIGLSVRSSAAAMDIPAEGEWRSPILVAGAAIRRVVPKLAGDKITLRYEQGRLFMNTTSFPASEA
jgi:hypothetical protein